MPIFEFIGPHGEIIERHLHRPQEYLTVDGKRYRRAGVQRFNMRGVLRYPTQSDEVRRGYYQMEQKGGRWPSDYSKSTIRRAWGI